ncbi:hypothetical protein QKU48_gp1422 [Fadolivirus algeromassiliense]|jgi:hypothetical protein|uniref:Uncharacterized protein n=1 Tax=Fadolivirus FV1/VV64 TaxID=3070911 RepID=A0A7D3QY03_9VIRU|nr:hypothetical protein QKU48_gp1422 [Fadolivirus algeromassiliense]QKF94880.1 hypothetical protein Fadolivirus_1_1422 [Fadolivirus FV1/VV64]
MSLYGMLFGRNPNSDRLMEMLELDTTYPIGRFRDIYLNRDGTKIILYTRNGGGNREHYDSDTEEGNECDCTGCIMTHHIPKHPNYIKDEDDDYDCTYAYVKYSVPEQYKEECKRMATGEKQLNVGEKFEVVINTLKSQNETK